MQQLQRGWRLTSEQENNDPFPKPLRPQIEGGGSSGDIVMETPGKPHKSPLLLSFGRKGAEGKKGQVSKEALDTGFQNES